MRLPTSQSFIQHGALSDNTSAVVDRFVQHGCDWQTRLSCAGVLSLCAGVCGSGVGTLACAACVGGSYATCKDCF